MSAQVRRIGQLRMKQRADPQLRQRAAEIGDAIAEHDVPIDRETGIALTALGLQVLSEGKVSRDMLLRFCERVLDTPLADDPRGHTGGT